MLDLNPLNGSLSPVYFLTMKMHCYDNQKRILKKLFFKEYSVFPNVIFKLVYFC